MINFTWKITQCDRLTSNNFITRAHWTAIAEDGNDSTHIYSTFSWQAGVPTIPYVDVTEAEVLQWIWDGGVDKEATEAELAKNLALQKNPVTATGVPWMAA
jgi:hypothetical protein